MKLENKRWDKIKKEIREENMNKDNSFEFLRQKKERKEKKNNNYSWGSFFISLGPYFSFYVTPSLSFVATILLQEK